MSEMTYTICPACRGSLRIRVGPDVPLSAIMHAPCPCTRTDHPGWAPTGVTLGQLERMADLERALSGDPGMPLERRRELLARLMNAAGWRVAILAEPPAPGVAADPATVGDWRHWATTEG